MLDGMQIRFGDCIPLTERRTIHPRCGVFLEYSRTQRKSLVLVAGPILSTERNMAVFWNIGFFSFYLHGPIVVKNAASASTARSTFRPLCRMNRALVKRNFRQCGLNQHDKQDSLPVPVKMVLFGEPPWG